MHRESATPGRGRKRQLVKVCFASAALRLCGGFRSAAPVEKGSLANELTDLIGEMKELVADKAAAESAASAAEAAASELSWELVVLEEDSAAALDAKRAEVDQLRQELDEAAAELTRQHAAMERATGLASHVIELQEEEEQQVPQQAQQVQLPAMEASLQEASDHAESGLAAVEKDAAETPSEMVTQVEKVQGEIDSVRGALQGMTETAESPEVAFREVSDRNEEVEVQADNGADIAALRQQFQEQTTELTEEKDSLANELTDLVGEMKELVADKAAAEGAASAAEAAASELSLRLAAVEEDSAAALDAKRAEVDQLRQELDEAAAELTRQHSAMERATGLASHVIEVQEEEQQQVPQQAQQVQLPVPSDEADLNAALVEAYACLSLQQAEQQADAQRTESLDATISDMEDAAELSTRQIRNLEAAAAAAYLQGRQAAEGEWAAKLQYERQEKSKLLVDFESIIASNQAIAQRIAARDVAASPRPQLAAVEEDSAAALDAKRAEADQLHQEVQARQQAEARAAAAEQRAAEAEAAASAAHQQRAASEAEGERASVRARAAEQRMADREAQYAPLAEHASALQRQLAQAQALSEVEAANSGRLAAEVDYYRGKATEIAKEGGAEASALHAGWVAIANHLHVKDATISQQALAPFLSAESAQPGMDPESLRTQRLYSWVDWDAVEESRAVSHRA